LKTTEKATQRTTTGYHRDMTGDPIGDHTEDTEDTENIEGTEDHIEKQMEDNTEGNTEENTRDIVKNGIEGNQYTEAH
jgi:hypothetical protein